MADALVRNRAIDEVRRARRHDTGLPPDQSDRGRGDPVVILARKETVRRLVQDIAELPDQQRAALLRREVDGASTAAVGHELGVSAEAAPDAGCACSRQPRPYASVQGRRLRRRPVPPGSLTRTRGPGPGVRAASRPRLLGLPLLPARPAARGPSPSGAHTAAVAAPGGPRGQARSGFGKVVAGAVAAIAVAGAGLVVLTGTSWARARPTRCAWRVPGTPRGDASASGRRFRGRSRVAYAKVEIPAGTPNRPRTRTVQISCPTGMHAVGLARPDRELPLRYALDRPLTGRGIRRVTVTFADSALSAPLRTRLGLVCKTPDATGLTTVNRDAASPASGRRRPCRAGERPAGPGPDRCRSGERGEPVAVVRSSASGARARIVTDFRLRGRVRADASCR